VSGLEPVSDWLLRERDERPDSPTLHYVLKNLDPQTWYQLEVTSLNNIGWSQPNDLFCFRTADGEYCLQVRQLGVEANRISFSFYFLAPENAFFIFRRFIFRPKETSAFSFLFFFRY